jgi:uncharacterized protein (TIGR02594 family)
MNVNYNVDLDPRLFGREASGKGKSSAAPADATAPQQQPASKQQAEKAKSKDAPEYRITEVAIVVPSDGLKKDQPFDIKGKVQPLAGTLTKKKVRIELITRYKDAEDKFASVEADIGSDNTFTGSCKQLFYHDGYQRDKEKPADAKFTLEAKASGAGAEKEVVSKTVDLPMATSTIVLKKGKYDDAWAKGHEATHPKSGKDFVPDTKVKKLQQNLVTFRLLPQKSDDGFFGDKTEAAVKQFQELAKKPERKKTDDIKIEKIDKITFNGSADGIVGEKTEKEIAVWLQNNWVKPDPEYRKGDVDDNGVKNKHGERGSDKHHPGSGILDLQKALAAVGAYAGKLDGWFGELMEAALKLFQDKASKGELVEKDGKKAEVKDEEKLKGHRNGVGDGPTVETVKKEADKGRKVEGEKVKEPERIKFAKKEIGEKEIKGKEHNPRIIEYHSTTTLKATADETAWCSAFVNWCFKQAAYEGTNSAAALSWEKWKKGKKYAKPAYGSVAVIAYYTEGETSRNGSGHGGFVVGKQGSKIVVLGGNQDNRVKLSAYNPNSINVKFKAPKKNWVGKVVTYALPDNWEPSFDLPEAGGKIDELANSR